MRLLAWRRHALDEETEPDEQQALAALSRDLQSRLRGPSHFATMLMTGVPEIVQDREDRNRARADTKEFPLQTPDPDNDKHDWAKWAPRWALVMACCGLLAGVLFAGGGWVNSIVMRQSEQQRNLDAAIARADARAEEREKIARLESRVDAATSTLTTVVDKFEKFAAEYQANHARDLVQHAKQLEADERQAQVTAALTKEIEALNAHMVALKGR